MKRLRLKKGVLIGAYLTIFTLTGFGAFLVSENMKNSLPSSEDVDYVNKSIIENDVEVLKEEVKIGKPYTDEKVEVLKYFYDYKADNASQEKSIIYHQNTYIQNSGIDFGLTDPFDVIAILDGTVTDIRTDDVLGIIVEIKHDNDFISSYQSLSEVTVKKNDTVKKGQLLGKSGMNTIDKDMGNHLHFELYKKGEVVDPSQYFDQVINNDNEKTTEDTTTPNQQEESKKEAE